ncbi:MAG: toast rack family protein [Anaerolineales bacterium]
MSKPIFFVILAMAVTSLACGFSVTLPGGVSVTPGATVTDAIDIPIPDARGVSLSLNFGAGEMFLAPGAEGALVSGSATYNLPEFKPILRVEGGVVEIRQDNFRTGGMPKLDGLINTWDLKLGRTPMDLTIQAGAYDGEFEFGGLALTSLTIKDGASDVKLRFSEPNQTQMSLLRYETGASNVTLYRLGNANLTSLNFTGGAGNYTLDFNGDLQRDAAITLESGVSNVTLIIPQNITVKMTVEAGLTNVSVPSDWTQNGNTYTQTGEGPTLTFVIKMGAGNLNITR